MDTRSDLELVAAINRGEAGAFGVLYGRHRDWVYRLAWRFTQHEEDALDVLQETFAYFARKFPGFVLTASVTTFLYPVVKNTAIGVRKKKRREGTVGEMPERGVEDERDGVGELREVLAGLSEEHLEVVLMRFVDGMTLEEIGAAKGLPTGTVKSRLHHAVAAMRESATIRKYFEKE